MKPRPRSNEAAAFPLRNSKATKIPKAFRAVAGVLVLFGAFNLFQAGDIFEEYGLNSSPSQSVVRTKSGSGSIPVFYPVYKNAAVSPVHDKLMQDIVNSALVGEIIPLDIDHPGDFLNTCQTGGVKGSNQIQEQFTALKSSRQPQFAIELLKYCAMKQYHGGLYLDSQSTLSATVDYVVGELTQPNGGNLAVRNDPKISPDSVHGALLYVKKKTSAGVIQGMIDVLVSTDVKVLEHSPLLLPKTLLNLINNDTSTSYFGSNGGWKFLQHTCNLFSMGERPLVTPVTEYSLNNYRLTQNCPEPNGLCCNIHDPTTHTPILITKHLLLPYQTLPPPSELPQPLNHNNKDEDFADLPYISTISQRIHEKPTDSDLLTPNFYEIMLQSSCLPTEAACTNCMRNQEGATCDKCADLCPCFCKALCHTKVNEKFIAKSLVVTPPMYAKDPSRLIPRIIHQTYYEDITKEKYPNMSRLVESFKQSGWEYKFYSDEESMEFLSTHFPPEVREAYETLVPGAFKADLFRYCVLLIYGGVYADVDILLDANLDAAIGPDIGFMTPHDMPGHGPDRVMCLWNGLIAAAPGHPFIAKAVETVVNNVRNRFTSVDYDNMFCPNPELSIMHSFDTLFTAGPCIMGGSVNMALGRHGQTSFVPGEIDLSQVPNSKKIPGKAIILKQNKEDMGSHRFTNVENNLVVASTDMPGADDREVQENAPVHYSKAHVKTGVYGLTGVYKDLNIANSELRIYVDDQWVQYTHI